MDKDKELKLLRKFKERSGWSYDRISKEIGIHHQTVQGWFTGKNKPGQLSRKAIREFLAKQKGRSI
ncbi:MAG: helix-turn-helix domain-containing protein [Planctomycetes bacterium]|nr:helix-turn-helix domain-containing protein [Planctomycetota bacterium]